MKQYGTNELREMYLKFFEGKDHLRLKSFSLVPNNDKSLLLINAGMAPLKPYFTGVQEPPRRRITTCQKCIRTGDIENVGKTSRHGTFFEMLGNFSFGDYFKEEVIPWAWEFVTEVLEMPKDRLYVTIYLDDDEAYDIWTRKTDIDPARIFRLGKEDNFWEHGAGPCGPCTEIHFDRADNLPPVKNAEEFVKAGDEDRVIEFWNLVFTQFDGDGKGNYEKLESTNIDTGMGLERIATIMQGVNNIFEIDTVKNILGKVCSLSNTKYGEDKAKDVSLRIITDHVKSVTMLIADGVGPSNEGRGYVLRRLLRRAARHGRLLGIKGLFLSEIVDSVVENYGEAYPELVEKQEYIKKMVSLEEERFNETIDTGLSILLGYIQELEKENKTVLDGDKAFKLYDTYGFPYELTEEICEEKGLTIDRKSFDENMENQRVTARNARGVYSYMGAEETPINKIESEINTEFVGYTKLKEEASILDSEFDIDVVIPGKTLNEVSKILEDVDNLVNITFTKNQILFNLEHTKIISRLLEGKFVNYASLLPQEHKLLVYVNRQDLQNGIERASLMSKEGNSNLIKLKIEDDVLVITSNSQLGKVREEVEINMQGEELEIAFNSRYLLDVLKNMEEEVIRLEMTSSITPCVIKAKDNDSYKYLILPVRLIR